jgi:hypothetical protein
MRLLFVTWCRGVAVPVAATCLKEEVAARGKATYEKVRNLKFGTINKKETTCEGKKKQGHHPSNPSSARAGDQHNKTLSTHRSLNET